MQYKGTSLFHFHLWFNTSRSFAAGFPSLLIRNDNKGNNFELQNFKKIKLLNFNAFKEVRAIFNKDKGNTFCSGIVWSMLDALELFSVKVSI